MANLEKLLCAELKRQLESTGRGGVSIPAGGELLWRWFLDLNRTRTYHAAGPNPIQPSEIEAYARSTGWPIEPRHIVVLRAMEDVWMDHAHTRAARVPDGVKPLPPVSTTPLSAGMVDALFG